jgi:cyanophycin synthetase
MRLLDSRRLTGPNLLLDVPGAILDVEAGPAEAPLLESAWRASLAELLAALGWPASPVASRTHSTGLQLAFGAPADVLYAATEIAEAACAEALARLEGAPAPDRSATVAALRASIEEERKPWLLALDEEASRRGVTLLADDKRISVGLGIGSSSWPSEESLEAIPHIPWARLRDIPTILVTGTNGKTTTARLLGAMVGAAGRVAGVTSTDSVIVGGEVVAEGDYSGPNGARTVLRDRRVEVGVLEVARGGILRRGLPVPRATAAIVTNVANDHLGEYGIEDLAGLADAKLVVAKAVAPEGRVVLNADDPLLLERGLRLAEPVTWFTLEPEHAAVSEHLARGGDACLVEGETLFLSRGAQRTALARVSEIPIAFAGAARHNVANALAAAGGAWALGFPAPAIANALTRFASDPIQNPGRANVWKVAGATFFLDFAHNPHGMRALAGMMAAIPATRRALVIGQAGDRDDESIRDLARAAWTMRPDRVIVKELESYLRGRERGVVPKILCDEFRAAGAGDAVLSRHESELDAVRAALDWARPGDVILLTVHEHRGDVMALLDAAAAPSAR